MSNVKELIEATINEIDDINDKIDFINQLKVVLHKNSPLKDNPVDCVLWVKAEDVISNDYNPNKVAPPEMQLLEVSIINDWYTQPIVTFPNNEKYEIVDGFHRSRVGKESKIVSDKLLWYLPIVGIRNEQRNKNDRIASTIRHNRARGKHQVDAMSEIIIELKNRNRKNDRIGRELWMDEEEILRLCQITGLQDLFQDDDFSKSWEAMDINTNDYEPLDDNIAEEEKEMFRTVNTDDPDRIFHTYDKWECYKAGFYATNVEWKTEEECKKDYYTILSNRDLFSNALDFIINNRKHSCEHYLTNKSMNRLAWLWQAAVCYSTGTPSKYSSGWQLLSEEEKQKANTIALQYLNKRLEANNRESIEMNEALSLWRQVNIY